MNKNYLLRRTIISKKSIILMLLILLETYGVLKYKSYYDQYEIAYIYENIALLFKFSVIIIEYIFVVSLYMSNYKKYYIRLRYTNLNKMKRKIEKDVSKLTFIFVFILNIVTIIFIKFIYGEVLIITGIKYIITTILFQLFSFLYLGYLYVTFFFKNWSITKTFLLCIAIYFVLVLFFEDISFYFVLPSDVIIGDIVNMIKNIMRVIILTVIFAMYNKDKVIEIYEVKK
ncbi:hypothetical protein [uncultured Clostridium sp.]|uniref:hypothetical protein n=1 Tax=uncultured Clostridium sp. TaxID=59620 RepID=UPI0025D303A4|nr:hypothetical protein [uncultured Clostridium sp.]